MKKRSIVLNDKSKIAKVISEMDKKKNEALQKAYEQVNKVSLLLAIRFYTELHNLNADPVTSNLNFQNWMKNNHFRGSFVQT
jgi:chromosome segregation ATPase